MRGLGKAAQAIGKILVSLGIPKWALVLVAAALIWFLFPKLVAGIEKDRARRVVKQHRLADESDRRKADSEALTIAGEDANTLLIVAREAVEEGRRDLAEESLRRLRATGLKKREIAALEDALYGPLPTTSIEATIRLETMLENGQAERARQFAERARRRWPNDSDLVALCFRAAPEANRDA